MGIREALAGVATLAYSASLGASQPAQVHLRGARANFLAALPPTGYTVRTSGAAVNLPKFPWLAILDPEVTRTAQSGLYVVYLYRADLTKVYVSMNQGATAHLEYYRHNPRRFNLAIPDEAIAELTEESKEIRDRLPPSLLAETVDTVTLGGDSFLPKGYEAGNIAAIGYELDNLPSEEQLLRDLRRFLGIYEAAVAVRKALTAADPQRYHTPAVASEGDADPDLSDLFRPKDASDYVTSVAAHTQVRSRRHESVVKAFGEHVKSLGWTPSTKVHPRDLVVTRSGAEVLCEIKVVRPNAEGAVREAIGQLFTYRHFLYEPASNPALLAVFSDPVGDAFVSLLEQLGIASAWAQPGVGWAGSLTACALGVVLPGAASAS